MSRLPPINRRDALKATTLLVGGAALASSGLLAACAREPGRATTGALSPTDEALVEELADTILPTTAASPGAKAAGAGPAINLLLTDCYPADAATKVTAGLAQLRTMCEDRCGRGFASMAPSARERLLREIDAEARRVEDAKTGEAHWFSLVRELSLRAYFSSEVGLTKALRWMPVPGRWTGCVPLEPGQPAWG